MDEWRDNRRKAIPIILEHGDYIQALAEANQDSIEFSGEELRWGESNGELLRYFLVEAAVRAAQCDSENVRDAIDDELQKILIDRKK